MALRVVILAAGMGRRMCSSRPKVLHEVGGVPILERVYRTARSLHPEEIIIVNGHGSDTIKSQLNYLEATWINQDSQLGTGHAVSQALPHIQEEDDVLVLVGDIPLIQSITLQRLLTKTVGHRIGLITANLTDPTGFGRIIRDRDAAIMGIVEHKDASSEQLKINEVNTGIIICPAAYLKRWLPQLKNNNAQKEYYLTDIFAQAVSENLPVEGVIASYADEVLGVNDRAQLAKLERVYQLQKALDLMLKGVTLQDPSRFDLRGELTVGTDVTIDVNTILEGEITLGSHVTIGPNCYLKDCHIEDNVEIKANTVIEGAHIHSSAVIGPFARIRPHTEIDEHVKIGNFVEIKESSIGARSKVSHLSYIGDARIGESVNVGAGTITCNYDGANKYQTVVENNAFIGSSVQLIAPVTVEAGATIAAGSVVSKTAPAEQLTISRAPQRSIADWKRPTKASKKKTKASDPFA